MASYEKRKKELDQAIPKLHPPVLSELTLLSKGVEEYMKVRDEVLTNCCQIAGDLGENLRVTDWRDKLGKAREALKKYFEESLRPSVPSKQGLDFLNTNVNYENMFWKSLEALDIGAHRDVLMLRRKRLTAYNTEGEAKWQATINENRPLREESEKAIKELLQHVDRAFEQTASLSLKLKNAMAEVYEPIKDLKDTIAKKVLTDLELEILKSYIAKGNTRYRSAVEFFIAKANLHSYLWKIEYESRAPRFRQIVMTQVRVLRAVAQARRDTEEFLKKCGVEVAKKEYEEPSAALERWSNELPTDGLKADAHDFGKALAANLYLQITEMEKAFEQFKDKHKGKLFGELASDVEKILVDTQSPEDLRSALSSKGLESKLKEWNDDDREALELNLEDTFRLVEERLQDQPESVTREIKEYADAFKDAVDTAKEWVPKLENSTKEITQIYAPEKVQQDFETKSILDVLRGK